MGSESKLRILKIVGGINGLAGTELSARGSAEALMQTGATIDLLHDLEEEVAAAYKASFDRVLGQPVLFDIPCRVAEQKAAVQRLSKWVEVGQPDVIHVHTWPRSSVVRRLARTYPVVLTTHIPVCPTWLRYLPKRRVQCRTRVGISCMTQGYFHQGCGSSYSFPGFAKAILMAKRRLEVLKKLPAVVAISKVAKDNLVLDGIPASKVFIVPDPVIPILAPEVWTPPTQDEQLCFLGRLDAVKGVDHLIRAMKHVDQRHKLVVVGDGPERHNLEALVNSLALEHRIQFTGWKKWEESLQILRQSALLVVPSLWVEQFGRIGPEAMSVGRPVVAYGVGGVTDWLEDKVTGTIVPAGDHSTLAQAIDNLMRDPATRRTMGKIALERASQWSYSNHAQELRKVFEVAMNNYRKPH